MVEMVAGNVLKIVAKTVVEIMAGNVLKMVAKSSMSIPRMALCHQNDSWRGGMDL